MNTLRGYVSKMAGEEVPCSCPLTARIIGQPPTDQPPMSFRKIEKRKLKKVFIWVLVNFKNAICLQYNPYVQAKVFTKTYQI